MEQPIIKDQERRWVDAIVKITAMTYEGRLKWAVVSDADDEDNDHVQIYSTQMLKETFRLVTVTRSRPTNFRGSVLTVSRNAEKIKMLSQLTVLDALAIAVEEMTVGKGEEDALREIESV